MKLRLIISLVAACLLVPALFAQQSEVPPLITVTGSGRADLNPEFATVRLGVTAMNPNASAAQSAVNATAQKIIDAVLKTGVERRHIQTSTLSLFQDGGYPGQPERMPQFRAMLTMTIRVTNLASSGQVVDAALGAGANTIEGISFGVNDDTAGRQEALKAAVREARAKAEAIAEALGVRVGVVYDVSESSPMRFEPMAQAMEARVAGTPIEPGQVSVSAMVTIRYRIMPR